MGKFLKQNLLPAAVFITGACVLVVEVVAVRVLAPHYGNTIFTTSSVITVVLAALSIGYYAGGKLADRQPSLRWFFIIILLGGLAVIVFHLLGVVILPIFSSHLSLMSGPLLSSLLIFFIPALLLGTLSPYALKLQSLFSPEQGIGFIAGRIFFWSTLGSIAGSLLAGFVLIPHFGVERIFMVTGTVLFILGLIPLALDRSNKKRLLFLGALILLTSLALLTVYSREGNYLYSKDGVYEKIIIYDGLFRDRPVRFFRQDKSMSGAMFLDSQDPLDLVFDYTKYFSVYEVFKPEVKNALVIGGGAYSVPKALLTALPSAAVDVFEIEPSLFNLAKEYFNLKEEPRLKNYTDDGRRLLQFSNKQYDLIFSDTYHSLFSLPVNFTTREFFTIAKGKLTDGGVFIANMIGGLSEHNSQFILAEIKTFQDVFPNSYFFAVRSPKQGDSQNIIFVGHNAENKISLDSIAIIGHANPLISSLSAKLINIEEFDLSPYPIFTDDFSPVEYLTAKIL
jgi:spermidine synthase